MISAQGRQIWRIWPLISIKKINKHQEQKESEFEGSYVENMNTSTFHSSTISFVHRIPEFLFETLFQYRLRVFQDKVLRRILGGYERESSTRIKNVT
jgi:hypothetical protein